MENYRMLLIKGHFDKSWLNFKSLDLNTQIKLLAFWQTKPLSCKYFSKMLSAFYSCCMYSNTLQTMFTVLANTMNPDQTAPTKEQCDLGPYFLQYI